MAQVIASIKIFPSEATVNLGELKRKVEQSLPSNTSVHRYEEEPIAFGISALIAHILMPEDESGKMEQIEDSIKSISDVGEIQVVTVGRV